MTKRVTCSTMVCALLLAPAAAWAGTIDIGGGWRANWEDGVIGITVDQVTPDAVYIQISKDYTEPPVSGVFFPRLIDFIQIAPDAQTVPRIVVNDETATNLTGADWTDYHWTVFNMGDAWFNVPLSMGFSVAPFAQKLFADPLAQFGDPNKATDLDAWGGVVPAWSTFFAGIGSGELVIDVDLANSAAPLSFTFKQYPTPEPTSLMMLALGGLLLRRQ